MDICTYEYIGFPKFQDFLVFSGISGICPGCFVMFGFYVIPEVREAFGKLPGSGALHFDQI